MIPKVSYNVYASNVNAAKNGTKKIEFGNGLEKFTGERISRILQLSIFRASVCKKDPNLIRKETIESIISVLNENKIPTEELIDQLSKEARKLQK